jgi:hypothetical protein
MVEAFPMVKAILITAVVIAVLWTAFTCPKCGRLAFFRHTKRVHTVPTPSEKTVLRVFSNGQVLIGPITLHDLALTAKYGTYDKDASALYPGHYLSQKGFDISLEWKESE